MSSLQLKRCQLSVLGVLRRCVSVLGLFRLHRLLEGGIYEQNTFLGRKEKALRRSYFFYHICPLIPSTSTVVRLTIRYNYKSFTTHKTPTNKTTNTPLLLTPHKHQNQPASANSLPQNKDNSYSYPPTNPHEEISNINIPPANYYPHPLRAQINLP